MNFSIQGDTGYKFKIGDEINGIKSFPISNLFKVQSVNVTAQSGNIVIPSQSQKDVSITIERIEDEYGKFNPLAIVGYDVSIAYYCAFQKMYLADIQNSYDKTANIRLTNTSANSYTTSRFFLYVLYVRSTCSWFS